MHAQGSSLCGSWAGNEVHVYHGFVGLREWGFLGPNVGDFQGAGSSGLGETTRRLFSGERTPTAPSRAFHCLGLLKGHGAEENELG